MRMLASVALIGAASAAASGQQVWLVDFGSAATNPTLGGAWNTLGTLASTALVDSTGALTSVTATFSGAWLDTSVDQGPWPHGDVGWVDGDATADYTFSTADAMVTFSGLIPGAPYRFEHIAARSIGTTRRGDYMVNGVFADSTPNGDDFFSMADGWTAGHILKWNSATASGAGEIVFSVTDVQEFAYINATRIELIPAPGAVTLAGLAGSVLVVRRRR